MTKLVQIKIKMLVFLRQPLRAIVIKGLQDNLLPQETTESLRSAMDKYSSEDIGKYISGKTDKQMEIMKACSAQASAAQDLVIIVFDAAKKKKLDTYGQTFKKNRDKFILELEKNAEAKNKK